MLHLILNARTLVNKTMYTSVRSTLAKYTPATLTYIKPAKYTPAIAKQHVNANNVFFISFYVALYTFSRESTSQMSRMETIVS